MEWTTWRYPSVNLEMPLSLFSCKPLYKLEALKETSHVFMRTTCKKNEKKNTNSLPIKILTMLATTYRFCHVFQQLQICFFKTPSLPFHPSNLHRSINAFEGDLGKNCGNSFNRVVGVAKLAAQNTNSFKKGWGCETSKPGRWKTSKTWPFLNRIDQSLKLTAKFAPENRPFGPLKGKE